MLFPLWCCISFLFYLPFIISIFLPHTSSIPPHLLNNLVSSPVCLPHFFLDLTCNNVSLCKHASQTLSTALLPFHSNPSSLHITDPLLLFLTCLTYWPCFFPLSFFPHFFPLFSNRTHLPLSLLLSFPCLSSECLHGPSLLMWIFMMMVVVWCLLFSAFLLFFFLFSLVLFLLLFFLPSFLFLCFFSQSTSLPRGRH